MKSSKQKNSENVHSGAAPFFQKRGAAPVAGDDSFFTKPSGSQADNIVIQKKCASCDEEDKVQKKEGLAVQKKAGDGDATPPPAADTTMAPAPVAAPAVHFIAEENATPEKGQMTKAAFMERLKAEICETVNSALSGTPFSSDNCPYIRASFAKHEGSSPAQIEALIIRYCPAAAKALSAEDVIRQMKAKVYAAAIQWAKNGGDLSGAAQIFGVAGDIGSAVSKAASGIGNAVSGIASGISNLFFKENAGGAASSQSPQAVMQSLGKGSSMDGGTKSKMEGAFESNFSNVEIHTDSNAAQLSKDMNARAFAVGNHIAFAGGEYQPGTLTGDALMAHELAHTMQQSDGRADGMQMKDAGYSGLEAEADNTAVNVMTRLTGKNDGEFKGKVDKGLKTGLTIQRCSCNKKPEVETKAATVTFSQVRDLWKKPGTDQKDKDAILDKGIAQAKINAANLFKSAAAPPISKIKNDIETKTGVGLEPNPMIGVDQNSVEIAYRAWAQGTAKEPWILLAIWKKEGLNAPVQLNKAKTIAATSEANAKALVRTSIYYDEMGADHYSDYASNKGSDNTVSRDDKAAPGHESKFKSRIDDMVKKGFLPKGKDFATEINNSLKVKLVSPGQYEVTPDNNFYILSLMLVDAFFRFNEQPIIDSGKVGADVDPRFTYMRWNTGNIKDYLDSADTHRKEASYKKADGSAPSIKEWSFDTKPKTGEYDEPRRNAIRFGYFIDVLKLVYEGY
jgi:hypothetical protein